MAPVLPWTSSPGGTHEQKKQRKADFVLILYHTNFPSSIKVQKKRQQHLKGKQRASRVELLKPPLAEDVSHLDCVLSFLLSYRFKDFIRNYFFFRWIPKQGRKGDWLADSEDVCTLCACVGVYGPLGVGAGTGGSGVLTGITPVASRTMMRTMTRTTMMMTTISLTFFHQ